LKCRNGRIQSLSPAPLSGIPFDGGGGVLRGNERIAFIPQLHALAGLFADFGELGGGFRPFGREA
jgi:hypothetical protein